MNWGFPQERRQNDEYFLNLLEKPYKQDRETRKSKTILSFEKDTKIESENSKILSDILKSHYQSLL